MRFSTRSASQADSPAVVATSASRAARLLERQRAAYVRGRATTLDLVRIASRRSLAARARQGWSGLEILEHVLLVERAVVENLERPQEIEGRGERGRSWIERLPVRWRLHLVAHRFGKVRAPGAVEPRGGLGPGGVEVALERGRDAVLERLDARVPEDWSATVRRHPVLGGLSGIEWIGFLVAHETRHRGQLRDVLRAATRRPAG